MADSDRNWTNARTFLGALLRDVRANTVTIMAMSLIPLAGMVGGGVDISRMYIVKTRLQHACDAGALAGRKSMGGGTWNQSNYAPRTSAENFFTANYQSDAYGATDVTKTFTENAGKVSGTASATLPMTLMRIFGRTTETLTVTCDAEMRLPNTDVMFVLDTTGSMASKAVSTDTDTKIEALRTAVKCFYEIVARLDTDATCTGGTPSGGTGDQVQIRFGFVPYSVNVNVGKLLPTAYFPNSWNYQARTPKWTYTTNTTTNTGTTSWTAAVTNESAGSWSNQSSNSDTQTQCNARADPANDTYTLTGSEGSAYGATTSGTSPNPVTYTWKTDQSGWYYGWQYVWSSSKCRLQRRTVTYTNVKTYTRTDTYTQTTTRSFSGWDYQQRSIDISGLKNGTNWNSSFTVPEIGSSGTDRSITWNGCIEERQTVSGTSFSPIPSGAKDLDIDSVPTTDVTTQWKPALGDLEYMRRDAYGTYTTNTVTVTPSSRGYSDSSLNFSQPSAYCPAESRKLQSWTDATTFDDYVDSLTPVGNTYHDIGMLWGARLMSPTGIFSSENAYTPQGGEIERHLIFMTDGDTQTSTENYAAYGLPWYDRRNVSSSDVSTYPGATDMNDEVNARFLALCTAVKNKNITLWVISFGSGSNTTTENRLSACATSGRYFVARDSATLQNTFRSIADQISQLRLTK